MTEVEQVIAALMIEQAKSLKAGKFRGPVSQLRDASYTSYGLDAHWGAFDTALEFLTDKGLARLHSYAGVEDYVSIDAEGLIPSVTLSQIAEETLVGEASFSFGPTKGELRYPIIATYLDVGSSWLHDFALSLRNSDPAQMTTYASSAWTGNYQVSEETRLRVASLVVEMRIEIEKLDLSNAERSNALSALQAIEALSDAANPAWALIIRILQSPALANVTALVALAVSLIKA